MLQSFFIIHRTGPRKPALNDIEYRNHPIGRHAKNNYIFLKFVCLSAQTLFDVLNASQGAY